MKRIIFNYLFNYETILYGFLRKFESITIGDLKSLNLLALSPAKFRALFSRDLCALALSSVCKTLLKKSSSLLLLSVMLTYPFPLSPFLYAISQMKNELN